MPVSTTWIINDMTRMDSDGGVIRVRWTMNTENDSGGEKASTGATLDCTYDASSPSFIAYNSLTENDVLGWVWNSLRIGDETAEEAKARVEAEGVEKVDAQIAKNATEAHGVPWS